MSTTTTNPKTRKSAVCRCLFGPTDHESLRKDLDSALNAQMEEQTIRSKWNYDFEADRPLEGRFEWSSVGESEYVPEFYRKGYTARPKKFRAIQYRKQSENDSVSTCTRATRTADFTTTTQASLPSGGLPVSRTSHDTLISSVKKLDFREKEDHSVSERRINGRSNCNSNASPRTQTGVQTTITEFMQTRKRKSPGWSMSNRQTKYPRV